MRIEVTWDARVEGEEGWYWVLIHDGDVVDDSMKVWTPVDPMEFARDQREELEVELREGYNCVNIVFMDER